MAETLTEIADAEETGTSRAIHPELRCVNTMLRSLERLDPPGRKRAILYLMDYCGILQNSFVKPVES